MTAIINTLVEFTPENFRKEILNEKEYTVLPMIMLKEGVLRTDKLNTLVETKDFNKYPKMWNGRPVTFGHPRLNGKDVPASDPHVLAEYQIGTIYNSRVDNNRLFAEAWIDSDVVAKKADVVKNMISAISKGHMGEVSSGFFADTVETKGVYDNQEYNSQYVNIVPDHLAILGPNEKGVCNNFDGCGIPRNHKDDEVVKNNSDCGCNNGNVVNQLWDKMKNLFSNEVNTMKKEELIKSLIDNSATRFKETDQEWLEKCELVQLQAMLPVEIEEVVTNSNGDQTEVEEVPKALSMDEYIKQVPPEIANILRENLKIHNNSKEKKIANLKATKRCSFTDEQLLSKSLEELTALETLANVPVDYTFQGVGMQDSYKKKSNDPKDLGYTPAPDLFATLKAEKEARQSNSKIK